MGEVSVIVVGLSCVAIIGAMGVGYILGKMRASTRVKVTEEKLVAARDTLDENRELLLEYRDKTEQLLDDQRDKDILVAELTTQIRLLKTTHEEKLAFTVGAREQLSAEFQRVAQQIFDEKSDKFTQHNNTSLNGLLTPLKQQLTTFSQQVAEVYDKDLRDRISLQKEITELKRANVRISDEALNLAKALKGDSKVQGDWGEMILERVLEMSGLQQGREYSLQPSYRNPETDIVLRPDAVVYLPSQKSVVVDSKVSLKHWDLAVNADSQAEEDAALKKHVESLRNHVKNLSGKQYETLDQLVSLDFVLMFVPIEAAFLKAQQEDPGLFGFASEKNVLLVSPSTLLVTLKTIRFGWQNDRQNKNAALIAQRAGALHDQFVLFVEALEDVGDKITKANHAYVTAHKRLSSGKGSIVGRVMQLEELGAKTKRDLLVKESSD